MESKWRSTIWPRQTKRNEGSEEWQLLLSLINYQSPQELPSYFYQFLHPFQCVCVLNHISDMINNKLLFFLFGDMMWPFPPLISGEYMASRPADVWLPLDRLHVFSLHFYGNFATCE